MKKKFITLVCAVCLTVVSLAGCGNSPSVEGNTQTQTSVTVEDKAVDTTEPAEKDNATEQVEDTPKVDPEAEPQAEPQAWLDFYLEMYAGVLNETYEYIRDFDFVEYDYNDDQYGIFENVNYGARDRNTLEAVGYTLMDITGDGQPELLIVAPDYEYDPEGTAGSEVLNIYGLNNSEPWLFKTGYGRDRLAILDDNTVLEIASMSSFSTGLGVYQYFTKPVGVEEIERIMSYAFEENNYEERYFRTKGDSWEYDETQELDMTEEDFWNMINEYESRERVMDITLFKDYKYTGSKQYPAYSKEAVVSGYWADDTMPAIADYVDPAIDIYSWQGKPVVFSTNTTVYDFTLWAVELYDVDDEGNPLFYSGDIIHMGKFTPEEDKLLLLEFIGDTPNFAVSYREADGTFKRFTVEVSGKDGSILLSEMN